MVAPIDKLKTFCDQIKQNPININRRIFGKLQFQCLKSISWMWNGCTKIAEKGAGIDPITNPYQKQIYSDLFWYKAPSLDVESRVTLAVLVGLKDDLKLKTWLNQSLFITY